MTKLPKKDEDLLRAVGTLWASAERELNRRRVWWYIISLVAEGIRDIQVLDASRAKVSYLEWSPENNWDWEKTGGIPFLWKKDVGILQREVATLSGMDIAPDIRRFEDSIASSRNAAITLLGVSKMLEKIDLESLKASILSFLVQFGTIGVLHRNLPDDPLGAEVEVIPPWQLLGLPGGNAYSSGLRGIGSPSLLSLDEVEALEGVKLPKKLADLDLVELPWGGEDQDRPTTSGGGGWGQHLVETVGRAMSGSTSHGTSKGKRRSAEMETFVLTKRLWMMDSDLALGESILISGETVLRRTRYSPGEVPMPIQVMRYFDTGKFYAEGLAERVVFPLIHSEALLKQIIRQAMDREEFGVMLGALDMGVNPSDFTKGEGPRYIPYNRDPDTRGDPIQHIAPTGTDEAATRVVGVLDSIMEGMASQGPMSQGEAPGRVDSASGLLRIQQAGVAHLGPTAQGVQRGMGGIYRSMGYAFERAIKDGRMEGRKLPLANVANSMVGLPVDPSDYQVKVAEITDLDTWRLKYMVKSVDPLRKDRRRAEALEFLQGQVLSPMQFHILNFQEGWDYPSGNVSVWNAYIKAVIRNLVFFGDGITPGQFEDPQVGFGPERDLVEVEALAIQEFVTDPIFETSSREVRRVFNERFATMEALLTGKLPAGMPSMEQAAAQQDQQMRQG